MNSYPRIILKPGKEKAVERGHPWLFSGAIAAISGTVREGDVAEVFSHRNEYLATGHYETGTIAVKLFSFRQQVIDKDFWGRKIREAYELRKVPGLTENRLTNAYRLVFGEGDGLPGLIIDFYNGTAVIQAQTPGMKRLTGLFGELLKELYEERPIAVFDKSGKGEWIAGDPRRPEILETGHRFIVDVEKGQKTGFFLDQRSNRMFAQFYAKGRKVLNAFSYSGAFSVYALKGEASMVHSVDSSRPAMEWTEENLGLNGIDRSLHRSMVADVKQYLAETTEKYEMIILDPPAFAKNRNVSHNALMAYIHINAEAMKRLDPGGLLFTFSCSQAISKEVFRSAVLSAALEAGREVRILHILTQGLDHPVSIRHPEGEYLKGLILYVS